MEKGTIQSARNNGQSEQCRQTAHELSQLETCRWSVLHLLLAPLVGRRFSFLRGILLPYAVGFAAFFGVLATVAFVSLPPGRIWGDAVKLPFLRDASVLFTAGVMIPVFLVLLLRERSLFPEKLASLADSGVLTLLGNPRAFRIRWERRFQWTNLIGQAAGLGVGIALPILNYLEWTSIEDLSAWFIHNRCTNAPGYIQQWWVMGGMGFLCTVILFRTIALVSMLHDLVGRASLCVRPFDSDNAGGLSAVGVFGLRIQWILAIGGLSILCFMVSISQRNPTPGPDYRMIPLGVAYLLGAPFAFLAPLVPFRRCMQRAKRDRLDEVGRSQEREYQLIGSDPSGGVSACHLQLFQRLERLRKSVSSMPVWPFDARTLKRFFGAYALPVLSSAAAVGLKLCWEWLMAVLDK